jgi:hypothetical protein
MVTWSDDSGCPDNGSNINGLDFASTALSSPSVKRANAADAEASWAPPAVAEFTRLNLVSCRCH